MPRQTPADLATFTLHVTLPDGHIHLVDITDAIWSSYRAATGPNGEPIPVSVGQDLTPAADTLPERIMLVTVTDRQPSHSSLPVIVDDEAAVRLRAIGYTTPKPSEAQRS